MSDICDLKSQICESNLRSNVVYFCSSFALSYEMDLISLRQALGIFLQILLAINKIQLCCSIFSIKIFSKLVPSFGELVCPFGNFFVSFLCLRLFDISSICSRDVFDYVKCKAAFVLGLPFVAVY